MISASAAPPWAVIEVVADGVPAGLGAPIYGKLDGDLAAALMSINAVKGVEIGAGFAAAALSGEDNADEMRMGNDGSRCFSRTMPAEFWAASRPGRRSSAGSRSSRLVDPHPRAPWIVWARPRSPQAPQTLRGHPRGADRRGHGGVRHRRSLSAPSGQMGSRRRGGRARLGC